MTKKECLHEEQIEYEQIFSNGTKHLRVECVSCGAFIKYKPYIIDTYKLWFGKHKGKMLKEVPPYYLQWYIENGTCQKTINRIKLYFKNLNNNI